MIHPTLVGNEKPCTCPSGDRSLRWPCPQHPSAAAGQLVGAAIRTWRERIGAGPDFPLHAPTDVERAMEAQIAELGARVNALEVDLSSVLMPKWEGEFKSFGDWVNRAQRALASPSHRQAICVDAKGRRCFIGKDFMRARDEDAFPIRYFWEFQHDGYPRAAA